MSKIFLPICNFETVQYIPDVHLMISCPTVRSLVVTSVRVISHLSNLFAQKFEQQHSIIVSPLYNYKGELWVLQRFTARYLHDKKLVMLW